MADDEDTWQNRLGVAFEGALKASPVIGPLVNATINPLTGERYQLWPEQMIRSGATLPGDVYSGKVPTLLGMRREDYTDIPQDLQPSDTWLGSKLGLREGKELGPSGELIARTQDLSGMAGGGFAAKPNAVVAAAKSSELAPLAALEKAPRFYSALENAVKDSNTKVASADQWLGELRNKPGVKQEELDWVLHDLPDGKIGKAELEQFVNEHKVELKEVEKGGPPAFTKDDIMAKAIDLANAKGKRFSQLSREQKADLLADAEDQLLANNIVGNNSPETKYSQWQLPGGSNYSERLLTLPEKSPEQIGKEYYNTMPNNSVKWEDLPKNSQETFMRLGPQKQASFTSSHWNEPNVLAHIRTNERAIPGVGNSLHIEEIQSDWHQAGRKQGYKGEKEELQPKFDKIEQKILDSNDESVMANPELKDALKMAVDKGIITKDEANIYQRYSSIESGTPVPDAAFKSNWADLSLKRIIRQAAEEGKDSISWTPGEAQVSRYPQLRTKVDEVHYNPDTQRLIVRNHGRQLVDEQSVPQSKLSDYIGDELSQKILKQEPSVNGLRSLKGDELLETKSGQGLRAFYDKMLVDKANAIAKKFGGKVESNVNQEIPAKFNDVGARHNAKQELVKDQPVHVLRLTPQLRDAALNKGFSLFADTGKVGAPLAALTRVEHNPFKLAEMEKQHGVKLTPVDENPFTTDAYHGTPNLKGDRIKPMSGIEIVDQDGSFAVRDQVANKILKKDFKTKEDAHNWIDQKALGDFYSTPNPNLAGDYAVRNKFGSPQIAPLKLDTRDYHTVDAKGKPWDWVNTDAIFAANQLKKKGVIIKNVLDDAVAYSSRGPQTVYITLDPSTVRSKFAKFDPAKYGESGLLKASGLPIYSDDKGNELMPPPPNPARIAALEPPGEAIATIGAKAAEWGLFALARNSPRLFASLNAAWGAQLPMLVSQFMMDDIRKQVREGKQIKDIKFEEGSLADAFGLFSHLEKKYGKLAGHLRPVEGNPFANQ